MQKVLRDEYTGDVHISTGMTTKEEVEKIVQFWETGRGTQRSASCCTTALQAILSLSLTSAS